MKVGETMDQTEFFLNNPPCLSVPVSDADKLLACDNPLCLKLYIYLLRSAKPVGLQRISEDLDTHPNELRKAAKELKSMGLMSSSTKGGIVAPADELPQYDAAYISKRTTHDPAFSDLRQEAEQILGKALSTPDLNTLFGIYDQLGLPPEVICMLLTSCREDIEEHYGPGRVPTMRQIEQQAYIWANLEILTLEQAEAYLVHRKAQKDSIQEVRRALGIYDRQLSKSENEYIRKWLDMGFAPDAINIAFDRTVTQTGGLKWAYMNRILESWHSKGLHTPDEINEGDKPLSKRQPQPADYPVNRTAGSEKERLMKLYQDISK